MAENKRLKAFVVFMRAYRAIQDRVKGDIARYGLNQTEFAVLELLFHKGDQPTQHIGKNILISSGSITYVVDKLESKGLLVRKHCPKDRRVIYASLTDEGQNFMREIFPQHTNIIEDIFSELSEEEMDQLVASLKKVGYYSENKA